jgi:16S rRNA U516 pseudouridylate synthase RsuA-like enzyme
MRVEIAGVELGELKPGKWRELTEREVARLKQAVGLT